MDILERLRGPESFTLMEAEAADEIERLREQVEFERASLRSAFQEMREYDKQIEWLRKELQGQALVEKK